MGARDLLSSSPVAAKPIHGIRLREPSPWAERHRLPVLQNPPRSHSPPRPQIGRTGEAQRPPTPSSRRQHRPGVGRVRRTRMRRAHQPMRPRLLVTHVARFLRVGQHRRAVSCPLLRMPSQHGNAAGQCRPGERQPAHRPLRGSPLRPAHCCLCLPLPWGTRMKRLARARTPSPERRVRRSRPLASPGSMAGTAARPAPAVPHQPRWTTRLRRPQLDPLR